LKDESPVLELYTPKQKRAAPGMEEQIAKLEKTSSKTSARTAAEQPALGSRPFR